MKQHFLYLLAGGLMALLFSACRKEIDYKFSTELAVDSRIIRLNANADTTQIIVYADGKWSVEPAEETDWMKLQSTSGDGKGSVRAEVTSNDGNLPRAIKLVVRAGGKTDTISLQQRGLTPQIAIADTTLQSIANGGMLKTVIATNVPLEKMNVSYRYDDAAQAGWLGSVSIQNGYLFFKADTNRAAAARSGVLTLSYLDALGTTTRDSVRVRQHPGMSFEGAVLKDFAYVKQSLAAGVIQENIYIEGIVISDKGHPNIAKNLNAATNKHTLDKTENAIAVYVQSMDGTTGLYLKTKTAGDNIFAFNDHVKIWLKGATLTSLTNPGRTVISNIEAPQVMGKESRTTPLQPREKYIGDLTDNDLYTYVKLKDVEISVPSGSFSNINEGYIARMDCYPTHIRDVKGAGLYMLTNLDVPYRRDGTQVPQGSGTIAGVLVSETLERYGGNIGKYAIRHLKREDIVLQSARENGFSNVLVEWSRFKNEFAATPTESQNPLTPETGTGRLFQTTKTGLDFTANGISGATDYNALLQEAATNKGAVSFGGWACKNWWNTTANKGEGWMIQLSTAGISKPISLQLEGNSDIGGPRNFVVEWAASNESTAVWSSVGSFTFEDVANWSNTLLTQVAGNKVVNFNFPQAASGLPQLYIRVRVANRTAGTTTNPTGGTLGATATSRLVHVSVKYNK
ncbi:hypothetical protein EGT74_17415 [Chitinophaga lutea]|uniref:Uncharacterized protein n=1 Tax=Chitinophaga lutea TaxID=2488634 RepID=A0A3N4PQ11_9BACT|nr:DUF5689 domain-containing protein [Chitinophaga lutea]RPE08809.1 hypothetical protein EGT74_17415 [Chitinophaga lutea]